VITRAGDEILRSVLVVGATAVIRQTRIESDGGSKTIAFSLSPPASSTASPTLQIVARLERADGWLVARGSAQIKAGSLVYVTLNAVMY
jgi:hypothetical protein